MNLEELYSALPHDGRLVVVCKNGEISSVRLLDDEHHIATVAEFIELVVDAGCKDAIITALA